MPIGPASPRDPIRKLGRTRFIGLAVPWTLSSFIRVHAVLFFGFPLALIVPRFLFRKPHPVVEWTREDWWRVVCSVLIVAAYSQRLSPFSLLRTLAAHLV
jgi:hypothetical protein